MSEQLYDRALVVLSGGQDSTTCLFWAKRYYKEVHAITFDYGQRHAREIMAARTIARLADVASHRVVGLPALHEVAVSALTRRDIPVAADGGLGGLPSTFVPGRNLVFLTVAASAALSAGVKDLVTGVCQTDYSGYPDCRRETIDALEVAIRLGNAVDGFNIMTPLMYMTKAESALLAAEIPGCMDALSYSVTCYNGLTPGCGTCPACELRDKGFKEAGLRDPAR